MALLLAGCSVSPAGDDVVDRLALSRPASQPTGVKEFDFGTVLAHGQELRHDFPLKNEGDRPLNLLGAEAHVPCCSSVAPIPRSIPAGGAATFPILLKVGQQTARRRVTFALRTDDEANPVRVFAVSARCLADREIEMVSGGEDLRLNQAGVRTFRIVCRRTEHEGMAAPVAVEARSKVRLMDGSENVANGLTESSRLVELTIPAESEPGNRSDAIVFRWADGTTWDYPIAWRVLPSVQVSPSALILRPEGKPIEASVIVRADDRPFRILGIEGEDAAEWVDAGVDEAGLTHTIRLRIDASRMGKISHLSLRTDHPDQLRVELTLLNSPGKEGVGE